MGIKKNNRILFVLTAIAALMIVISSACANPQQNEPSVPAAEVPLVVQRVTIEESKEAFDNGEAVFLDVRSESSYAANHIPGALSIPLNDLQSRMDELDSSQWIITYCT
jgi:3-mercaptopyruvate sulfurtransferase SseA